MSFNGRLKRGLATVGSGAVVLVGTCAGVVLMSGVALAHNPQVTPSCQGLGVSLTYYAANYTNTVTVKIDGSTVVDHQQFGTTYTNTFNWTTYASHTWAVDVFTNEDPNGTAGWTKSFSGTQTPCTTQAISTAPTFSEPTCQVDHGVVHIPAVTGAQYSINNTATTAGDHSAAPGSTVHVTVAAVSGQYVLTGDTGPWDHTFGAIPDCTVQVTPVAPTFTESQCVNGSTTPTAPTYTIPATTGVDYFVNGANTPATAGSHTSSAGATVTIVAKPQAGYRFNGAQTVTYSHIFNASPDCTVTTSPVSPTVTQSACAPGTFVPTTPTYTIPNTTGVDYFVGGTKLNQGQTYNAASGTTVVVHAVPQAGYRIAAGAPSDFTLVFSASPDCTTHGQTIAPGLVLAVCDGTPGGVTPASITIPALTGADYFIDGVAAAAGSYPKAPGTYTVTVVAQPGFTLAGLTSFPVVVPASPDCNTQTTPVTPSVSQYQCIKTATSATLNGPTYTIPATTGVSYSVNGQLAAPGTYDTTPGVLHITASPKPGYELAPNAVASWDLTVDTAPTCVLGTKITKPPATKPPTSTPPTAVLPFTGNNVPVAQTVVLALLAVGMGAALTLAGRPVRRRILLPELA